MPGQDKIYVGGVWKSLGSGGGGGGGTGSSTFIGLTDVPATYVGSASKVVSVKADVSGLEFTAPSAGNYALIEDKYLSAGDAVSFDFTSIPATYKHLKIMFFGRSNNASWSDSAMLKFNNDAGNNYCGIVQWNVSSGTTVGQTNQVTAAGPFRFVYINANTSDAGLFANSELTIFNYSNGNSFTTWQARGHEYLGAGSTIYVYDGAGTYKSTTAINQITLYPLAGSNFRQYSRATLYGLS